MAKGHLPSRYGRKLPARGGTSGKLKTFKKATSGKKMKTMGPVGPA